MEVVGSPAIIPAAARPTVGGVGGGGGLGGALIVE